jgi:hypothetical protein
MKRLLAILAQVLGIGSPTPPQRQGRWRFS